MQTWWLCEYASGSLQERDNIPRNHWLTATEPALMAKHTQLQIQFHAVLHQHISLHQKRLGVHPANHSGWTHRGSNRPRDPLSMYQFGSKKIKGINEEAMREAPHCKPFMSKNSSFLPNSIFKYTMIVWTNSCNANNYAIYLNHTCPNAWMF